MYIFYNQRIETILRRLNISYVSQKINNIKLEEYLFSNNFITENEYIKIKSELFNIPIKDKSMLKHDILFLNKFKREFYEVHQFIIIKQYDQNIVLTNNFDLLPLKQIINLILSNEYKIYFVTKLDLVNYIDLAFNRLNDHIEYNYEKEENMVYEMTSKYDDIAINNYPIVKLVEEILEEGIEQGASDIHFEPNEDEVIVKMRFDGKLYQKSKINILIYPEILTRIKIMANINITVRNKPQDGKIKKEFNKKEYDLRISTLPTIYGERISIRVLNNENLVMEIDNLGLNKKQIDIVNKLLNKKNGILLVCGPTGCGKSTTLYTFLKKLCNTGNNIITIEDPVEYSIKGVNQVQVNNKMGITFASCLRSILRQDPNIIMIGEIRDEETAEIAIRASITGHLVFSTLHTNDSFTAITRLIDMKVPSYLVSEGIIGVISQRLVRRLCDYCKEETYLSSEESDKYFLNPNKKIYKEVGCSFCNNTGYIGRVAVYEILEIDSGLKRLIVNDSLKEDYEKYINFESCNEFISISDSAKDLLYKGVSSLEEIKELLKVKLIK